MGDGVEGGGDKEESGVWGVGGGKEEREVCGVGVRRRGRCGVWG